jgi:hypothetical protein
MARDVRFTTTFKFHTKINTATLPKRSATPEDILNLNKLIFLQFFFQFNLQK